MMSKTVSNNKPLVDVKLKIGDKVKVYAAMCPKRHFKCIDTITAICPMYGGTKDMVWLDNVHGAWHPDAVEKIEEQQDEDTYIKN